MEPIDNDTIFIEMVINAPVQDAWKAWTKPELILKWFGSDPNGKGLNASLDVRVGGRYEIAFENSDQTGHSCSGVYLEVNEPAKLVFDWEWKSEPGVISIVSVLFASDGCHTRMRFEHAHVGNESAHNYDNGWRGAFLKLEQLLKAI